MVGQLGDGPYYGACFDNQQDSLAWGAIVHCMHPVPLYHTTKNIASPLIANAGV